MGVIFTISNCDPRAAALRVFVATVSNADAILSKLRATSFAPVSLLSTTEVVGVQAE